MISKRWVLLRGLTRSRFHWLGFDKIMQEKLNLTMLECPEIPGNGYLSDQLTPTTIDETVLQLRSQITQSNEPFGLLGVSLGGMIAVRWQQMFPQDIAQLVLANTSSSLSPFYQRLMPKNYFGIIRNFFIRDPAKSESFIMKITSNDPSKWQPHLQNLIKFHQQHPVSLRNFKTQLELAGQVDFSKKPTVPTLILTSDADKLVSNECSKTIAKKWNLPLKIHPTSGHDLSTDAPVWITEQIKNWNLKA